MKVKIKLLTPVPRHSEFVQITHDAQKIEDILNAKLTKLAISLQKLERQDPYNMLIANDYREKAATSIRRAVEQIYQLAGNYAADFTKKEYFTTGTDISAIASLAEDYNSIFWGRLQRFTSDNSQANQVKPEFIIRMTTASLTQETLRKAIIIKSQSILNPPIITTSAAEEEDDLIDVPAELEQTPQVVYVWVTSQDDKVCRICSGFEGQAWPLDNADAIPDIPDDTHPNCRCIIQLSEAESIT